MGVLEDLFGLEGRVAVVTGGAKGIGMFYSEALAGAGANVVVADIDGEAVADTAHRLNEEFPGKVLGVDLDVSSRDSIRSMVSEIDRKWGRIDILVNNAAIFSAIKQPETPVFIPEDELTT